MYNTYAKFSKLLSAVTMITARRPKGGKKKCANTKSCTF